MALITCPDCGKEVSEKAAACIHCGAPLGKAGAVTTTQQTGKRYKLLQLAGVAVLSIGVVMIIAEQRGYGTGACVVGLLMYAYGRMAAWWQHG